MRWFGNTQRRDPRTGETALEAFLYLFFSPSERSQAAGKAFWERRHLRKNDVDSPNSPQTMAAHLAATNDWRQIKGERFAELKRIGQPTLVVNGSNDIMVPTINSFTLSQRVPNAHSLSGLGPRVAISISRAVRLARANFPR
jgi:pimeloyl-ACP methyl ester carboxylesterase